MACENTADLHMHTVASDGTCTVSERINQAQERGLSTIAITDHDSISSYMDKRCTNKNGIELITGVEVRADIQDTKVELLGYYVDPEDERLAEVLTDVRTHRKKRNMRIIERLNGITSLNRSYPNIQSNAEGLLGRPHIAQILIEEDIVDSISAAFDEYLASDGKAFVPMERVPAAEIIDAIQGAGGVVSLAHPGRIRSDSIEEIVDNLVEVGLDAIEVQYPYDEAPSEGYADVSVADAATLAEKHELLQTGGSDCHGPDSGKFRIGAVTVSEAQLNALRNCADQRRSL